MKKFIETKKCGNIPIFFATDDNYVPYLVVSIQSLKDTASIKNKYMIYVLNTGLNLESKNLLKGMETSNIKIRFVDVSGKIRDIFSKLKEQLRDYYSPAIYYRLFIATMFPQYKKALYLDCDITILRDIADLYNHNLENNLLGGVVDEVVSNSDVFCKYMDKAVGVDHTKYFNSGILVMNLEGFRRERIEQKFIYLLNNYPFSSLCPDQDYLNILCKDRVLFLEKGWDKMPIKDESFDDNKLYLVHYNMFQKPWKYSDVLYDNYFWDVAKRTPYYNKFIEMRDSYTKEMKERDIQAGKNMFTLANNAAEDPNNFKNTMDKEHAALTNNANQEYSVLSGFLNILFDDKDKAKAGI